LQRASPRALLRRADDLRGGCEGAALPSRLTPSSSIYGPIWKAPMGTVDDRAVSRRGPLAGRAAERQHRPPPPPRTPGVGLERRRDDVRTAAGTEWGQPAAADARYIVTQRYTTVELRVTVRRQRTWAKFVYILVCWRYTKRSTSK
jgi:hypothetical protein